ncbi:MULTISPECIES: hypothetical protein [Nitrosopumilus]|uniref:Uncharacterized protein n=1 Tax=Nitrosopumilus piranensis TaxID=1582439 RepID=A0A0C5BWW6_9ARCH|nr:MULTISPECIES: hypothetical protein [Nitrosopumilus]AJM92754.1 hypothetical protein NPIRD3C_1542 [Nitrosopumilus piranensis]KAF6244766.1 hypothetical protein C6989_06780 [Nitrosopumilus sp. b2]
MVNLILSPNLEDKIFEIKYSDGYVSKITSYFPLTKYEKQEIISIMNIEFSEFHSIFTDTITEEEWNKTKEQIKKRFNGELFDIDKKL